MIRTLLRQVKQYKKDSLLTPMFMVFEVVMELLIPVVTASIVDDGIGAGNMSHIYLYGALMLVMAMCSLFFGMMGGKYAASASSGFACNVREAMFEKIQRFSFSNIDKFSTAGLVTRLTTDVTNIQNAYQMILRMCIRSPLMLLFAVIMCLYLNVRLSVIFLVAIAFMGICLFTIIVVTMKVFDETFKKYDDLNASVQENISAIRVVKAFVREQKESEKFTEASGNLYRMFVKAESNLALNGPVMMISVYGCILALSWFGAHFIVEGTFTTGELTAMFSYVLNIMMSLMMLSMIFVMLTLSAASARRINEVLSETPDLQDPQDPIYAIPDGSIDFNHVSFSYQHTGTGKATLSDIDVHIRSGETIGVVGGTGSGKSSFVSLISRLYDVTEGSVCVGGHDVRAYDMEMLRNQVAVVLQKNELFSGTILDNLRWGNEEATEEACIEACKQACADEFIEQLPNGYHTFIERGGANVSGGQKQRLCIARALLKKPKILILDDSTSAVDTATDARIRQAFAANIANTTKLIIAQRISSVQEADRILVLEDGHVDAFDTHENLLRYNAIYQEMYDSQVKGGGDFDRPQAKGGADTCQ